MLAHKFGRRSGGVTRIAAVLVVAAATVAGAQTAAVDALFRQFGLFGAWASDCGAPASPGNPHVSIAEPSPGLVLESHDLGPNYTINRYTMVSAERLSAEQLSVEAMFQLESGGEERQKLVFLVRKSTRRTMFNQADGGAVRVKDGVVIARGIKTPVLKKCD